MPVYYVQINSICLILLGCILGYMLNRKQTFPTEQLSMVQLVAAAIVLCIADAAAGLCSGNRSPAAVAVLYVSKPLYYFSICWAAFAWLQYGMIRIFGLNYPYRRVFPPLAVPAVLLGLALAANSLSGYFFTVSEGGLFIPDPWMPVCPIVPWGYFAAALVLTVKAYKEARTRAARKEKLPLLLFMILPAMCGVLQMLFSDLSLLQCGITLSLVLMLYADMAQKISRDALTGLNNRRALMNYINRRFEKGGENYVAVVMDINRFKHINDDYGHSTGDRALITFARALMEVCGKSPYPLFLFRYGGDEFVILSRDFPSEQWDGLFQEIDAALARQHGERAESFGRLTFSAGVARGYCENSDDAERLLLEADRKMYMQKKQLCRQQTGRP